MAAHTDYATLIASLAAGKAYTDEKAQAQVENVQALSEAATGCPILQQAWHPYDMVEYGDGNDGVIYDFAVDGSVATITTPTFAAGYEYAIDVIDASTADITLNVETGGSFGVAITLVSGGLAGLDISARIELLCPMASRTSHLVKFWTIDVDVGTGDLATSSSLAGAAAIRHSPAATLTRARIGGSFGKGKVKLHKRLAIE